MRMKIGPEHPEAEAEADHVRDAEAAVAEQSQREQRCRAARLPEDEGHEQHRARRRASRRPRSCPSRRRCRARFRRRARARRGRPGASPTRSARSLAPKVFGRASSTSGTEMMPTGTLIQKIACQFQPSTTAPPMSGPAATPRPATPPQMPIASGRSRRATDPGDEGERERHERGAAEALHGPGRDELSGVGAERREGGGEGEDAGCRPTKTVRRPKRSPSATAMRMKLAKLSVYALTNHCSSSTVAPRSAWMTGSALVMTRLSRVAMNMGSDAARIASQTGMRRRAGASSRRSRVQVSGGHGGVLRECSYRMITRRDISYRLIPCQAGSGNLWLTEHA